MKKFIVTFHAPASAMEQMGQMATASPEEQQKAVAPWMEWAERAGSALVDAGSPLMGGQTLSKSGSSPSDKGVVGYSILQAEDPTISYPSCASRTAIARPIPELAPVTRMLPCGLSM